MKIPIPKLKAILLYFTNYTDTKFLGKVKLMKLFYFLDFTHLKKYGTPVTYDDYYHLEHGPIPTTIKNLVDSATDDIDNSILADTISIETPEGFEMYRVKPKREFTTKDEDYFSESEMEILNEICHRFGDQNTKAIEDAAHHEAPWRLSEPIEKIPYLLAAQDPDCLFSEEEIELITNL